MRISKFLRMQTTLKRRLSEPDEYGQPVHAPEITIRCAIQDKSRIMGWADKAFVVVFTSVFTDTEVNVGDILNNREVAAVTVMRDLSGAVQGYEATLK